MGFFDIYEMWTFYSYGEYFLPINADGIFSHYSTTVGATVEVEIGAVVGTLDGVDDSLDDLLDGKLLESSDGVELGASDDLRDGIAL